MGKMLTELRIDPVMVRRLLGLVLIIIPLSFAGNMIYIAVTSENGFLAGIGNLKFGYLFLSISMALFPWIGQSTSIRIWGRVFGVKIPSRRSLNAVLASDIGAAVTPTILGGGYAKLAFMIRYGFSPSEATLVTFLGSLADFVFFALALPAAVIWTRSWENPYLIQAWHNLVGKWKIVAAVIIVLIAVLIFLRRIKSDNSAKGSIGEVGVGNPLQGVLHRVGKFGGDLSSALRFVSANGKRAFLTTVILSGFGWCGRYGAISAIVAGFGYPVDPVLFFLLQWIVFTTMTMIPTPGAVGGAEVSFALVYNGLIPASIMPLAVSAWRFVTFYTTVGLASIIFAFTQMGLLAVEKEQADIAVAEKASASS